jgi:hypothetical protein
MCDHVKRIGRQYLETEGIIVLEMDRLIISLAGSASDSCDTELEDDVDSDGQLSGTEDLV